LRKDLNLAAAIQALQSKDLLEILAEPTVPAVNGKPASFLAGGEFPFPMVQPSTSGAVLSLSWREYGVRLNFLPILTPRGAIRLQVTPEVSSLDYTHSVTVQGFTVPALATRRVQTEVELESGQSFVIAGLIDNEMTQTLSRVPGLASLPILGKLFQSKSASRSDNELLVIVTPEIVRPIPEGQPLPELKYPQALPSPLSAGELRQPGLDQTGGLPPPAPPQSIPVEQLLEQLKQLQPNPAAPPAAPAAPAAPAPAATAPGGRPR
jgi:pilus assembly protein CpaC